MSVKFFRNANTIVYGSGALEHLKTIKSQRALVFSGVNAMEKSGVLANAVSYLNEAGAKVEIISGIKPDPLIENIEVYLELASAYQPDLLVALGGGSVIDSAKALWASYEHPEIDRQDLFKAYVSHPYPLPKVGRKARLIAIPSTSGTGSESSGVAILIESTSRVKRVLLSMEILPNVAILDPDVASHMPPQVTAHTGLDALTHALESLVSPWSTDFSEPLAFKALKLIFQNLRLSYQGSNQQAREKMHYAATMAGMAINNSITGLAHGMDKIGLQFDLSHGLTCGVILPYTIIFNASNIKSRYAQIARNLGFEGKDEEELTLSFINNLAKLEQDIGIPHSFKEMGIEEGQYTENVELVIEYAMKSGPTVFSPKVPSWEELRQLFLQAYHGKLSN